jgi:adenine-specific DNA methylase
VNDTPPSLIEVQLPVSSLSKESYRERKAVAGQTLTALGKWWGRKPLVLVRALILGLLMPATDDPDADRAAFLAAMTMDEEGLARRRKGPLPASVVFELATARERERTFAVAGGRPKWKPDIPKPERDALQAVAFARMSYEAKLEHCVRPEEIDGASPESWARINAHLGTNAGSLPELIDQLGNRRFGHRPRVGDAFSGGGSIPFEAARIGCDAYGNDLSPVAALLTWGALEVVGGGDDAVARVTAAQRRVYDRVRSRVAEWGIERNEAGWEAEAYLYCVEATDPVSGWRVPLAPSWVIADKPGAAAIAQLRPDVQRRRFDVEIVEDATASDLRLGSEEGTWRDGLRCPVDAQGRHVPPRSRIPVSIEQVRGRDGLRAWEAGEFIPRDSDVLGERLYCVVWVDPSTGDRHYRAPTDQDLAREAQVQSLLAERFGDWQKRGFIPSRRIEAGNETERLGRERGWTHWHQLFNPRQLLVNGLFGEEAATETEFEGRALLLMVGKLANWNSRLSRWKVGQGGGIGGAMEAFYNQAFNTLMNYASRTTATLEPAFAAPLKSAVLAGDGEVSLGDARGMAVRSDFWITDPGYADAIDYEELSEHFLAWYDKRLPVLFPGWYTDSRRALAISGAGFDFRRAMIDCYQRMAELSPDDGLHVVMFTHQSADVWADLALILWTAGLRVTTAWTVQTETPASGLKQGNYVQGTVLLVLRKRIGGSRGHLGDIFPEVQAKVRSSLASMSDLRAHEVLTYGDADFGDADLQLAAYAAALSIVTGYERIEDIDPEYELFRERPRGERSPLALLIEGAVKIASDYLVPGSLDRSVWSRMTPEERFYLRGVLVEASGEHREGVYQEFARALGVREYRGLLATGAANEIRLKTPSEFGGRELGGDGFAGSLLRRVLFAIHVTARSDDPREGLTALRTEVSGYWDVRPLLLSLLRYLTSTPSPSSGHWISDAAAAGLLAGAVDNDRL